MTEKRGDEGRNEEMEAVNGASADGRVRTVETSELLGRSGILRIEHQGEIYTLRITRNNRLILTQ